RELSADEKARDMYERQEKARRDFEWAVDYEVEKGIKARQQEWLQEGRQEGRQEGYINVARNLIKMNIPIDDVIAATGLSREEIMSISN
ncbi:MAG: hypothetical protein FWG90_12940, partial [Oscillospiraceae bacterium]|nr:hypothetical protein [Oscillospiraceae bacterium]